MLLLDENGGQQPLSVFKKIKQEEFLKEDQAQIDKYKNQAEELLSEIEHISKDLEDHNIRDSLAKRTKDKMMNDPEYMRSQVTMQYEIEGLEQKAKIMEEEASFFDIV
jgi:hypothetical protein